MSFYKYFFKFVNVKVKKSFYCGLRGGAKSYKINEMFKTKSSLLLEIKQSIANCYQWLISIMLSTKNVTLLNPGLRVLVLRWDSNDYIPYKQWKYIAIMRKNASACINCEFRRPWFRSEVLVLGRTSNDSKITPNLWKYSGLLLIIKPINKVWYVI